VRQPSSQPRRAADIALSAGTHDRAGERRADDAWLQQAWHDRHSRIVPVAVTRLPVTDEGDGVRWHTADALPADGRQVFLGMRDGVPHFALLLDEPTDDGRWTTLRSVLAELTEPDSGFMVHAVALAEWHASHRFCPRCAGRLRSTAAGHVLVCEQCGRQQFPRSDPAVIMLVTDGERALLGRQDAWPEGRYSTLAGFVDPGESLEDAVVREVAEETGVEVTDVTYFGNQPWPFPQSLMVGFFARAVTTDIRVDGREITDARWFSREQLRDEAEAGTLVLPGGVSISRSLVESWYSEPLPGSW
jgi:NAD+ diphosphatase